MDIFERGSNDGPSLESNDWLTGYLLNKGLDVVDKRNKGGSLWVIGGEELRPMFEELVNQDIYFQHAPNRSRSTKRQPGWYM